MFEVRIEEKIHSNESSLQLFESTFDTDWSEMIVKWKKLKSNQYHRNLTSTPALILALICLHIKAFGYILP